MSSLVLLAAVPAVADAPGPSQFADIAPERPQNYAVVGDFAVIDYGSLQCLLLPGEPARMQVQWSASRTFTEAREFARRFFRSAIVPRTLGVNFGFQFEFAVPAVSRVNPYLNLESLRDLLGGDVLAAGFKARFEHHGWRALMAVEPGASANQLTWQINFERNVASAENVNAALEEAEALEQSRDELVGRLAWAT
jgi:hypothetical protein